MSPRSSIGCVHNNFWAYVTFGTKRCTYLASRLALSLNRPKRLSVEPRHLGVASGVSKIISEPMVHLVQTLHLSCTKTNTVSKQTETRFHKTQVTLEFYRVRPKLFPSLWYVQCKLWNYLASRLAKSPNGLKQASTWASSPRSTIEWIQIIPEPVVCLTQFVHLSCTDTNTVSKRTETRFDMTHVN
jgi:hypothetical protein